jgi:hypothetical protein
MDALTIFSLSSYLLSLFLVALTKPPNMPPEKLLRSLFKVGPEGADVAQNILSGYTEGNNECGSKLYQGLDLHRRLRFSQSNLPLLYTHEQNFRSNAE